VRRVRAGTWWTWIAGLVVSAVVVVRAADPPPDAREGRSLDGPSLGIGLPDDGGRCAPRSPFADRCTPAAAAPAEVAPAAAATAEPARVERVSVAEDAAGGALVRLEVSGDAAPHVKTLRAAKGAPARIYIDLPAVLSARVARQLRGAGPVRRVRTAQFARDTARVVIDLTRDSRFQLTREGRTATIAIEAPPAQARGAKAEKVAKAEKAAKAAQAAKAEKAAKAAAEAAQVAQAAQVAPAEPAAATAVATAPTPASPPEKPKAVAAPAPAPAVQGESVPAPAAAVSPAESEPSAATPPAPPSAQVAASPPAAAPAPPVAGTPAAPPAQAAAPPPGAVPVAASGGAPAAAGPDAAAAPAVPEPAFASAHQLRGATFVWPDLDAPAYVEPDATLFRRAIISWRRGRPPESSPRASEDFSAAARALAADLLFLDATAGRTDFWAPVSAYEGLLRSAPDFGDADRVELVLGYAYLSLELGPEAGMAFRTLERDHPDSPLVPFARLGRVAVARVKHRLADARALLDETLRGAVGGVRCRGLLEATALARADGEPTEIAGAFRALDATCPDLIDTPDLVAAFAEALAASGEPDEARRVLAAPHPAFGDDELAGLVVLAGRIAADAGDVAGAQAEYQLAAGMNPPAALRAEIQMRQALLSGQRPQQIGATLESLAARPAPPAVRFVILGEASEAFARAGQYEDALAALDEMAELGHDGRMQADARRAEVLGRWIASTTEKGEDAETAVIYSAHATDVEELVAADDRIRVAGALGRLGLHAAAVRLLRITFSALEPSPEIGVALAEQGLAAGDLEAVQLAASRLAGVPLSAEIAERLRGAVARALLIRGDVEGAAESAAQVDDLEVRAVVARALLAVPGNAPRARQLVGPALARTDAPVRALLVAGAGAAEEADWDAAAEAYRRALDGASGAERVEAAAGLARAESARGDVTAAREALARARGAGDPALARAVEVAARAFAAEQAPR
jgi:AMIN domain